MKLYRSQWHIYLYNLFLKQENKKVWLTWKLAYKNLTVFSVWNNNRLNLTFLIDIKQKK